MDAILSYKASPDEDYYAILGCQPENTMEQITAEYRLKARELHPDKNKGEEVEVTDQFKRLQEAKETLTDPNRRADYDKWRTSGLAISWKEWKAMKGKTHAGMHWAPPKTGKMLKEGGEEPKVTQPSYEYKNHSAADQPETRIPFSWTRDDRSRRFQNYEF